MKEYVKTKECRRKTLLSKFDNSSVVKYPQPIHLCCDNCAGKCKCGSSDGGQYTTFPGSVPKNVSGLIKGTRQVTLDHKKTLHQSLTNYHKSLVKNLIKKSNDQVKTLKPVPSFFLDFQKCKLSKF